MIPISKFILKKCLRSIRYFKFKSISLANTWWHETWIRIKRPIFEIWISAYVVHVGGARPTSASHVGPSLSASVGHVGGSLLASVVHAEDNPSATASHVDTIEKTTRSKHKLKFPCKLCEGDHLTYKFPSIAEVRRVWIHGHPVFQHSEVSQQPTTSLS